MREITICSASVPSVLRNRRTGESFAVGPNRKLTPLKSSLFTYSVKETPKSNPLSKKVKETLTNIEGDFALYLKTSIPEEHFKQLKPYITPENLNKLMGSQSFVPSLYKTAGIGLLYAALPAAAATSLAFSATKWIGTSGIPQGGVDMCAQSIKSLGCIQGFMANGTSHYTSQIMRQVTSTQGLPDVSNGYYQQLRNCMDLDKLFGMLSKVLDLSAEGTPLGCSAESTVWNHYQLSSAATGLTATQCQAYQAEFASQSTKCMSYLGAALKAGLIAGIAIGAVIALLLLCYLGRRICQCIQNAREARTLTRDSSFSSAPYSFLVNNNGAVV